jgi:hypothetical protein
LPAIDGSAAKKTDEGPIYWGFIGLLRFRGIDGKTTAILRQIMEGNEIAVETPSKSLVAGRNLLDSVKLAREIPVNWDKVGYTRKLAGEESALFASVSSGASSQG